MKRLVLLFFICISYSQTRYGVGDGNGIWKGRPCDDTEHRNYSGLPKWKNYGEWLSECDSLASAWEDSTFAIVLKERHRQQIIQDSLEQIEIANIDFDKELDMDAMWDNTVWNEITDIGEEYIGEVEQITAVAGVRGAEAEDEALQHLYYRRSMRGLQKEDLERAYGKLLNKKKMLLEKYPDSPEIEKINSFLTQLKMRMKIS